MQGRPVSFIEKVNFNGNWVNKAPRPGTFHQFGKSFEDHGEDGAPEFTTCIIEDGKGQMHEIVPSLVKFIDKDESDAKS